MLPQFIKDYIAEYARHIYGMSNDGHREFVETLIKGAELAWEAMASTGAAVGTAAGPVLPYPSHYALPPYLDRSADPPLWAMKQPPGPGPRCSLCNGSGQIFPYNPTSGRFSFPVPCICQILSVNQTAPRGE